VTWPLRPHQFPAGGLYVGPPLPESPVSPATEALMQALTARFGLAQAARQMEEVFDDRRWLVEFVVSEPDLVRAWLEEVKR
jgi:hypothetical protein